MCKENAFKNGLCDMDNKIFLWEHKCNCACCTRSATTINSYKHVTLIEALYVL